MTLRWTESGFADMERISAYYLKHATDVEQRIMADIYAAVEALPAYPLAQRETSTPGIRRMIVRHTPYVVTYRVTSDTVEVLRIRHTSQKPLRY